MTVPKARRARPWGLLLLAGLPGLAAQAATTSEALREPGATVPWITYEAEDLATDGEILGPGWVPGTPAAESSGRRCVRLAPGGHLTARATAAAQGVVVRYSLPDAPGGSGTSAQLRVLVRGQEVAVLDLDSRLAWSYGTYPFVDDPAAGAPRRAFDEVRRLVPEIRPGDDLRLELRGTTGSCLVDLIDLEAVPPPLTPPADALAVTAFGAQPGAAADAGPAFRACLAEAARGHRPVWIPAGTFRITGTVIVPPGVACTGAGMWHTTLVGDPDYADPAKRLRIQGGDGCLIADVAVTGHLDHRDDREANDGFSGSFGTGSTLRHLWVEHTKVGAWIENTRGLRVDGCRFRNTIADGLNLALGTQDCQVIDCTSRGTGDDGFAVWPALYRPATFPSGGNLIHHCTARLPLLGNGLALYGGDSNRIADCRAEDTPFGAGILVSTAFAGLPFSGRTVIERCHLERAGGFDTHGPKEAPADPAQAFRWRGAFHVVPVRTAITGLVVTDLAITESAADGLGIQGTPKARLEGTVFERLDIRSPGRRGHGDGIRIWASAQGGARIAAWTCGDPADQGYRNDSPGFTVDFAPASAPTSPPVP